MKVVVRRLDTLYSSGWLDLTKGRWYSLYGRTMLSSADADVRTDVFASPGWRTTGTGAGNFLITPGWRPTCASGSSR
jgi:hypothetical protein